MTVLLDTHAVVWYATEDARLGRRSRSIANAAASSGMLAVSAVSFWEIALLAAKKRLQLFDSPAVLRALLLDSGIHEFALTGDIALLSVELSLHGDPADRFIAATAIVHRATLVTADQRLLGLRHRGLKRQNASR
ncbi:MAG: ribonuclease VapC [Burkholderiales bacterium]|nr:MAG: ribonuclease VapC [Burkholderiales bacterium]